MRILVADHDPESRVFLERVLRDSGYDVVVAADQASIWAGLMPSDAPLIGLIDCSMPGLDGLDLFRNVRATIKDHGIHLIMLTSRTDSAYINESIDAGADNYLARPIRMADLRIGIAHGRRLLELEDALAVRSGRDALTGLHNREASVDILKKEAVRCQRDRTALSIIYTDLDCLQLINDRNGHLVGDAVLQEISRRLRTVLRPYDHLGRCGDDELLMILPACNTAGALEVAERARMAVAAYPIETETAHIVTSITSVTATLSGRKDVPADRLLQLAQTAMYRAKEKGRNQVGLANLYCSIL